MTFHINIVNHSGFAKRLLAYTGIGGIWIALLSEGALSDTAFSSYSGTYASELEKKQESLTIAAKDDIRKIKDGLKNKSRKGTPDSKPVIPDPVQ